MMYNEGGKVNTLALSFIISHYNKFGFHMDRVYSEEGIRKWHHCTCHLFWYDVLLTYRGSCWDWVLHNKPFSRKCILPQDFSFAITFTLAYMMLKRQGRTQSISSFWWQWKLIYMFFLTKVILSDQGTNGW